MRFLSFTLSTLLLFASSIGQTRKINSPNNCPTALPPSIPTVNFCDLDRDPSGYDGKVIRTRVRYLVGGETRIVYDKRCKEDAWVEFDYFFKQCTDHKILDKLASRRHAPGLGLFNGMQDSEIVAVGLFVHDRGGFGHMNAYKYEFTIKWIEKVSKISEK